MANLSITALCNRSCSYCFTRQAFEENRGFNPHMSVSTFDKALDVLERSGMTQVRLLGGEPTLHPEFDAFVRQAIQRGFDLMIFSNGLMPESALRALEDLPEDRTRLLINMTDAGTPEKNMAPRHREVFYQLGNRIMLGYNIFHPAAEFTFLLAMIEQFNLIGSVRLGLAHPCRNGANQHLHPRYYPVVGDNITAFTRQARDAGVEPELDCGFVPCMFSEEGFKVLGEAAMEVGRRCSPIPDIMPDGRVVPCYPLSDLYAIELSPCDDTGSLRDKCERKMDLYRPVGIYRECSACGFFTEGLCNGGCLSAAMGRLRDPRAAIVMQREAGHKDD